MASSCPGEDKKAKVQYYWNVSERKGRGRRWYRGHRYCLPKSNCHRAIPNKRLLRWSAPFVIQALWSAEFYDCKPNHSLKPHKDLVDLKSAVFPQRINKMVLWILSSQRTLNLFSTRKRCIIAHTLRHVWFAAIFFSNLVAIHIQKSHDCIYSVVKVGSWPEADSKRTHLCVIWVRHFDRFPPVRFLLELSNSIKYRYYKYYLTDNQNVLALWKLIWFVSIQILKTI